MDFSSAINTKIKDISESSDEPFLVYRDKDGWHCDHTQNQYGERFDWVKDVLAQDPLAIFYTGADFSKASFSSVYDTVLCDRIRAEYYNTQSSGKDSDELAALTAFFNDNVSSFSHKTTDYLTTLERPLAALAEMCPFSMKTDYKDWNYNEELAYEAIERIENEVNDRLQSYPDEIVPEKRYVDGYLEKHSIQLAGRDVIFAENPKAEEPYLVCFAKTHTSFGMVEYLDIQRATDYVEAMWLFNNYQATLLHELKSERTEKGLPVQKLTASDCLPESDDKDWTGRLLIVKPDILAPEYRSAEHQLVMCTGGFGARPNSRGNAVYIKELHSDKQMRYERYQIAGIADPDKLPQWAKQKLAQAERLAQKAKSPDKKPSLLGKLDDAKAEAAEQNKERNDAPKKKKHGMEV